VNTNLNHHNYLIVLDPGPYLRGGFGFNPPPPRQGRRHGFEGGGSIFASTASKFFLGPPHILQGPPLTFGGGSFQNVGGPEKFFYTVV